VSDTFHTLRVSMTDDFLTTRFTCTAPEGSACRLICTNEDCEPETWTTDGSHEHELRDSGKCSAKEWFEAVDWTECHESFGHESVLYDGPVNAFWDGEDFQWQIDRTGPDAQVTQLTQDLAVARRDRDLLQTTATTLPDWATSWAGRAKCKVHGTRLVWVECGYGDSHRVCLETAQEDSGCRPVIRDTPEGNNG